MKYRKWTLEQKQACAERSVMASIRKHAESVMWFIPVYNNLRKKDSLGHMTPFAFRKANPKGTYLILL